jgi:hypothetical protein
MLRLAQRVVSELRIQMPLTEVVSCATRVHDCRSAETPPRQRHEPLRAGAEVEDQQGDGDPVGTARRTAERVDEVAAATGIPAEALRPDLAAMFAPSKQAGEQAA